jgi:methyltransferase (TIGR00027 family)
MTRKRIETTTSRTAEMTCIFRAMSSFEKESCYKSNDNVAVRLLPRLFSFLVRMPQFRGFLSRKIAPKGIYEYVIARTKYIDAVFKEALAERFGQVSIFGAGFDTRALRFRNESAAAKIFELDVPVTQNAKMSQYRKRGLPIPPNLVFVPIDFDRESLPARLEEAGFDRDKRSLFILEGLLMYLQPESVDLTFRTIREFAGVGSEVVFDYVLASVLRNEGLRDGGRDIAQSVSKAGEQWHFGIEKGDIGHFLTDRGFRLLEHLDSHELEQRYFRSMSGKVVGRVNGSHCLVRAAKA